MPELKTGPKPALKGAANVTIRAYTDLLLHDMGPELADGRPDFKASGREWRTRAAVGRSACSGPSTATAICCTTGVHAT